ncbi:carboxymuconolactone decarboxylase family protein [Streptacidiphilus sp. PAMC 29251]
MPRIAPLEPPYSAQIDHALRRWMPPGVAHEPLALFRVLQRNPELASRMFALGAGLLGHGLLPDLDREIVIARVTARAGCGYEWGVHASAFSQQVGLSPEQLRATADPATTPSPRPRPRPTTTPQQGPTGCPGMWRCSARSTSCTTPPTSRTRPGAP